MIRLLLKYRLVFILACLPSFFLPFAAAGIQWTGAYGGSDAESQNVIAPFVATSGPSILLSDKERIRLKNFQSPSAILPGQTLILFDTRAFTYFSDYTLDAITGFYPSAVPIRSPPCCLA